MNPWRETILWGSRCPVQNHHHQKLCGCITLRAFDICKTTTTRLAAWRFPGSPRSQQALWLLHLELPALKQGQGHTLELNFFSFPKKPIHSEASFHLEGALSCAYLIKNAHACCSFNEAQLTSREAQKRTSFISQQDRTDFLIYNAERVFCKKYAPNSSTDQCKTVCIKWHTHYACVCIHVHMCCIYSSPKREMGFPGGSDGKDSTCNISCWRSIPGLGRFPGEGNGNPLQYSCLEKPSRTEEPDGLQSMSSQRVRHNWATNTHTHKRNNC